MVQWLRLCTPNAGGPGSIPGQGTRFHMCAATKTWHRQKKKIINIFYKNKIRRKYWQDGMVEGTHG